MDWKFQLIYNHMLASNAAFTTQNFGIHTVEVGQKPVS